MADYTTRPLVKDYLGVPAANDSEDASIDNAIAAAENQIDQYCARTFVVPTGTSTRTVRPWSSSVVILPAEVAQTTDLAVAVDLVDDGTAETALTSSDWFVGPGDEAPFTELIRVNGSWPLPRSGRASVEVTAWFGYAMAVPDAIQQAALMLAARMYQRRSSPLGIVAGVGGDTGPVRVGRIDHDVAALLAGYRRAVMA